MPARSNTLGSLPELPAPRFGNGLRLLMLLEEFDYDLPARLIAQRPGPARDASRLLVVRRGSGSLEHRSFRDLPDLLTPGDLLVLNDTRVVPARLLGRRERSGGKWEGLFLRERSDGAWELLSQTRGRLQVGEAVIVVAPTDAAELRLHLEGRDEGHWLARPESSRSTPELLACFGHVPLPPYIRKGRAEPADVDRYQTVYAAHPGAVAAPTAGLHFTPAVFDALRARDIDWVFVTLHVGAGTFQPVKVSEVSQHRVAPEWCELTEPTANAITTCRARGGRVVAVGTTSVRVLETAGSGGRVAAWKGPTDLTICPSHEFHAVDALVTNFHLPRSSLLLLVAAFGGIETVRAAYREAVEHAYRFYSYGDAMLIV